MNLINENTRIETVTPKVAQQWLNSNTSNRALRTGLAEKYARDMSNEKWTTCPVPISFYANGELADGQHRLWAIVESGKPQTFIIVRGLSKEDGLNIDTGMGRTLIDNADISGVAHDLSIGLIAACRAIEEGDHANNMGAYGRYRSNADKLALVNSHREVGKWLLSHAPSGKGLRVGPVMGAVGRAWYHESDKDRMAEFGKVVTTGFYENDADTAAVAIRNYLISNMGVAILPTNWRDTMWKTENALWYFMRRKPLTVVRGQSAPRYTLNQQADRPAPTKRIRVVKKARAA